MRVEWTDALDPNTRVSHTNVHNGGGGRLLVDTRYTVDSDTMFAKPTAVAQPTAADASRQYSALSNTDGRRLRKVCGDRKGLKSPLSCNSMVRQSSGSFDEVDPLCGRISPTVTLGRIKQARILLSPTETFRLAKRHTSESP